jgi:hypothetical protein
MAKTSPAISIVAALALATFVIPSAANQTTGQTPKTFALWKFDEAEGTCRAKGRLQDKEYCDSRMVDQVVAQGKAAIPILISQITDSRETPRPIYDFWDYTNAGDVATFLLNDLFTDSDWKTFNMPGLEGLREKCDGPSWVCWHTFVKKHGRTFIQKQWLAAWSANKDRVYWSAEARCFRLSPKATGK